MCGGVGLPKPGSFLNNLIPRSGGLLTTIPIKQLQEASPDHLNALSRNALFLRQYEAAVKAYDDYMSATDHWFGKNFPHLQTSCALRIFLPNLDFIFRFPFIAGVWEF